MTFTLTNNKDFVVFFFVCPPFLRLSFFSSISMLCRNTAFWMLITLRKGFESTGESMLPILKATFATGPFLFVVFCGMSSKRPTLWLSIWFGSRHSKSLNGFGHILDKWNGIGHPKNQFRFYFSKDIERGTGAWRQLFPYASIAFCLKKKPVTSCNFFGVRLPHA